MSDAKISALPSAATLTGAERLPVSQSNQTRGATAQQIKTFALQNMAINVKDSPYNALGDGVTDDTAAIQAALTTGKHVYFPGVSANYKISVPLTLAVAGQRIFGDGPLSRIIQSGTNANAIVFQATSLAGVEFSGLWVTPGTTVTSTISDGVSFLLTTCDYAVVRDCRITGHRHSGVRLLTSNYCKVINNWIYSSVVLGNHTEAQVQTGFDIYVSGSSSHNTVEGNHCINGCGVGVGIQTANAGDHCDYNIVSGNEIYGQAAYGIMLYQVNATDVLDGNVIVGNVVRNISGAIDSGATNFYGAGIYIQTAEHTIVHGNQIKNTNTDRSLAYSGTAVPAAIALTGGGNADVVGNIIEDCYWGIAGGTASAYAPAGRGFIIANNAIRNCSDKGIYLPVCQNATITGNRLYGSAVVQGILIIPGAATGDDFIVTGNRIANFATGIEFDLSSTTNRAVVAENIIRDASSNGLALAALSTNCHDNTIICTAGNGIRVAAVCVDSIFARNTISGAVTGINIVAGATRTQVFENILRGNTTPLGDAGTATERFGNRLSTGAMSGRAVMVNGTVTVNTAEIQTADNVLLTRVVGTATTRGILTVGTIVAGTSFVIRAEDLAGALSADDDSTVFWEIVH